MRWLVYAVTLGVVVGLGELHAHIIGDYQFLSGGRGPWDAVYVVVLGLAAYGVGLPDLPRTVLGAWVSASLAVATAAVAVSLIQLVVGSGVLPRFVIFGAVVILVPSYAMLGVASEHIRRHDEVSDRVLVVARRDHIETLRSDVERAPERPAAFVATIDLTELDGAVGASGQIAQAAKESKATLIVLDREAQGAESVVAQVAVLHGGGTRVRTLSLFYEEWLGKLPLGELERMSLMFDIQELHAAVYSRVKRFFDVVLGLVGTVALVVAVPVVAVLDLIGNRGSILYRQRRVGKGGARVHDPQVQDDATGLRRVDVDRARRPPGERRGRWLRRTHIDELPQVLNVLRGDLSFVGPRPEQPAYVEELRQKIPFYDVRHLVHPGLTGWAQVKFEYGATVADALEKLQYEFFYLRHQSLTLDARIVARTLRSVLWHQGR